MTFSSQFLICNFIIFIQSLIFKLQTGYFHLKILSLIIEYKIKNYKLKIRNGALV